MASTSSSVRTCSVEVEDEDVVEELVSFVTVVVVEDVVEVDVDEEDEDEE